MKKVFAPFKITKIQKAAIFVACIVFGILIYMKVTPDFPVFTKKDVTMTETIANEDGVIEVEESLSAIEEEFLLTMTDEDIADAIHSMSHQKVISEDNEKWGKKIPLTFERVDRLLVVLDAGLFEHKQTYITILERWAEGDFSQVARDHNAIWYNQGGTFGEATGIMSPEEEMDYIKTNFDVNE